MTVLELAELVEALKEKFGVTAAAPVAVAQAAQVVDSRQVKLRKLQQRLFYIQQVSQNFKL